MPPNPIASPGESSIRAALYPEETDYLYFVANKEGNHIFSRTFQEHLHAKNANTIVERLIREVSTYSFFKDLPPYAKNLMDHQKELCKMSNIVMI